MNSFSLASQPEPHEAGQSRQRAWVEVDSAAISHNTATLVAGLMPGCRLMAVVKADGYGHGAVPVARAALAGGASSFGVATLAEGVQLRRAGITAPVLVLGNLIHPDELRSCLRWQLMPTLSGMREALLCQHLAAAGGRPMGVHLKLDTGMTRLGVDWRDGPQLVAALHGLADVELKGVYTHLANADAPPEVDDSITSCQQQRFATVLEALQQQRLDPGCRHLANSAATLRGHAFHHDMVRVGLALYGHSPAAHLQAVAPLRAAMQLRARVSLVRTVPAGTGVSYGHRFRTSRPSRLAVVGIGYADGVPRQLSGQITVLHRGRHLPQVGAITMDQLVLDATDAPDLEVGDVVTLLGHDGDQQITPAHWSQRCQTIPWEILCGFKHRLPRLPLGAQ